MNNRFDNDDEILIAKIMDKKEQCGKRNRITFSDYLNDREQMIVKKNVKLENCFWFGDYEKLDRKVLVFYPDKLSEEIARNAIDSFISIIRIKLPREMYGRYEHRDYLSGVIKLGIDRAKVGDILVFEDGADVYTFKQNVDYLMQGFGDLTRFRKSEIVEIDFLDVREKVDNFEEFNIIVPSLRIDSVVSEIIRTSRNAALEYIEDERVLVNYELVLKGSRMINIGDVITVRGKGKFIIDGLVKNTRSDRMVIRVKKYA